MIGHRVAKIAELAILLALTSGCAAAVVQRFDYRRAIPRIAPLTDGNLAIGTHDRRPYVVSGQKREQFVGLMQGGWASPFDVVTASGSPFAADVTDVLAHAMEKEKASMTRLTFRPGTDHQGIARAIQSARVDRAFVLTIFEWKTESFFPATDVHFDLGLEQFSGDGRLLRASEIRGTEKVSGLTSVTNPTPIIAKESAAILQSKVEDLFSRLKP